MCQFSLIAYLLPFVENSMGRKGGEKECFTRLNECSLCHMYIYGFSYSHFASRIGIFGPGCANSRSLLIYYRL